MRDTEHKKVGRRRKRRGKRKRSTRQSRSGPRRRKGGEEKEKKVPQDLREGLVLCSGVSPLRLVSSQVVWSAYLQGSFQHFTARTTPSDCFTLWPKRRHPVKSPSPRHVHTLSAQEKLSRHWELSSGSVPLVSFSLTQLAEYETRLKDSCRQHVKISHKPVPTGICRSEFTLKEASGLSSQWSPKSVQHSSTLSEILVRCRFTSVPQGTNYTNVSLTSNYWSSRLLCAPLCGTKRFILDPSHYQGDQNCTLEGTTPATS